MTPFSIGLVCYISDQNECVFMDCLAFIFQKRMNVTPLTVGYCVIFQSSMSVALLNDLCYI